MKLIIILEEVEKLSKRLDTTTKLDYSSGKHQNRLVSSYSNPKLIFQLLYYFILYYIIFL